jgi:hypothetical protein
MPSPGVAPSAHGGGESDRGPVRYSSLKFPAHEIERLQISSGGAETTAWFAQRSVCPSDLQGLSTQPHR